MSYSTRRIASSPPRKAMAYVRPLIRGECCRRWPRCDGLAQRRDDPLRPVGGVVPDRLRSLVFGWVGFEAGAGVDEDDRLLRADESEFHQRLEARERGGRLQARVAKAQPAEARPGLDDLVLGHRDSRPAGLAQAVEDQEVADGGRHPQPGGHGRRTLPRSRKALAGLERTHDRRAALGLDGEHPRAVSAYQAQRLELRESLPHTDDAGAAAGRIDDRVRQPPAQLLGELETHGLFALDPIRLLERAQVERA